MHIVAVYFLVANFKTWFINSSLYGPFVHGKADRVYYLTYPLTATQATATPLSDYTEVFLLNWKVW